MDLTSDSTNGATAVAEPVIKRKATRPLKVTQNVAKQQKGDRAVVALVASKEGVESSRGYQRLAALFLGGKRSGRATIDVATLREFCKALCLFDHKKGERDTFGANFTQNMKKDRTYFKGNPKKGWALTKEGKAEAKRLFGTRK